MKSLFYNLMGKLVVIIFVFGISFISHCQPPGSPPGSAPGGVTGDPGDPPCWDPNCVPIDGGVGFLIAAGAVLGFKKIKDHKKQSRK